MTSRASLPKSKPATSPKSKPATPGSPTSGPRLPRSAAKVKVLSSKRAFHGKVFDVFSDMIAEPGGQPHIKDVIRHHGSAVILPVQYKRADGSPLPEPEILLERQYRHATGQYLWEIPAGRLEARESPLAAAKRELAEETGYRAKRWSRLASYYASPGFLAEKMQMFLAEDLKPGQDAPDADEMIVHKFFPLNRLLAMVERGQLQDAKTMVAVLLFERRRAGPRPSTEK